MIEDIIKNSDARMKKGIEAFKHELSKLRTGRANPSLVEDLIVEYYGSQAALKTVANITVSDPRTLSITPWDKNMVKPIEKAIMNSNLGLNPAVSGNILRIPLPPLTEERRKELVKVVKTDAEHSRVAIRNIRRDANDELKSLLKQKSITEDDEKRTQERIQKLTDSSIAEIDKIVEGKEKELMTV